MVKGGPRIIYYNLPDMSPHPIRKMMGRGRYLLREFRWDRIGNFVK